MKVLYFNNMPTDVLWREWQAGVSPSHHLWGVPGMRKLGLTVDVLPQEVHRWLKRVSKWVKFWGDLDQQIRALRVASRYDVLYCGCQHDALLICFLRNLGLVTIPTVITMHHMIHPLFRSRWMFKLFFGSASSFVCLHRKIADELTRRYGVDPAKVEVIEWGVDAEFYERAVVPAHTKHEAGGGVVAAGRTFRDYDTLVCAVRGTDIPVQILCTEDARPAEPVGPNVQVQSLAQLLPLKSLLGHYADAAVVAIPMVDVPGKLVGLTSLFDAMAMGKPVVMTANPFIDVDIEKEGIGFWVAPGDRAGWTRALTHLRNHPDQAIAMGERSRTLVKGRYHIDRFAKQLAAHLLKLGTRT